MSDELKSELEHADRQVRVCNEKADRLLASIHTATDVDTRALAETDAVKAQLDAGLWQQIADEIRAYLRRRDERVVLEEEGALW